MKMRFLIYGKGWISSQIITYLEKNKYEYIQGNVRVNNTEELKREIISVNPTNILCLIGRTHGKIGDVEYSTIDYLEQSGKLVENIRDNLFSQTALAIICQSLNIHVSFINTGCIFNYDDTHTTEIGFMEADKPNFFGSSYSIVKGFTDQIMHLLPVCNLRIRMPITAEPNSRNFITKITKYDKICSVPNSMTVLDDFIPIIIDLSINKFVGTLNLTNPGVISHNEILEMYKEFVDPSFTWKNFTYEEQIKILAAGRSNNYLDTTLLTSMYPNVPDIKTSIRNTLIKCVAKEVL